MALGIIVHGMHEASTPRISSIVSCTKKSHSFQSSGSSDPSKEHSNLWDTELTLVLSASGTVGQQSPLALDLEASEILGPTWEWETQEVT